MWGKLGYRHETSLKLIEEVNQALLMDHLDDDVLAKLAFRLSHRATRIEKTLGENMEEDQGDQENKIKLMSSLENLRSGLDITDQAPTNQRVQQEEEQNESMAEESIEVPVPVLIEVPEPTAVLPEKQMSRRWLVRLALVAFLTKQQQILHSWKVNILRVKLGFTPLYSQSEPVE